MADFKSLSVLASILKPKPRFKPGRPQNTRRVIQKTFFMQDAHSFRNANQPSPKRIYELAPSFGINGNGHGIDREIPTEKILFNA